MVAVAHASPADLRRLVLVHSAPVVRPARSTLPATVYHRRRMVALIVVVAVGAALLLSLQGVLSTLAGGALSPSERPQVPASVYVVRPGDTFWEIARQLRPNDDPRPLVARMVAAHGSPVLVAGERLALPAAA